MTWRLSGKVEYFLNLPSRLHQQQSRSCLKWPMKTRYRLSHLVSNSIQSHDPNPAIRLKSGVMNIKDFKNDISHLSGLGDAAYNNAKMSIRQG